MSVDDRRSFLVAVPAMFLGALFAPRLRPPPPPPTAAVKFWAEHGAAPFGVCSADGKVRAVVGVPDAILDDPSVNLWQYIRPRLIEALAWVGRLGWPS